MTPVLQPSRRAASATLISPARVGSRDGDLVGVADPLDGIDVERAAVRRCGQPGGVEQGDQLVVAGDRAEPADQLDGRGRACAAGPGGQGPVDDELVGGAGVPADPDPDLGPVGLGQQGDVGDQGAQQPLAVRGAGGGRVPQGGQVGGEFLQARPGRAAAAACRGRPASACSASARAASLASQRASRVRATSRFSGSTAQKARSARSAS